MLAVLASCHLYAKTDAGSDTIRADTAGRVPGITTNTALMIVDEALRNESLWRAGSEKVRKDLRRLLEQTEESWDSARLRLSGMDFSSIPVHTDDPVLYDSAEVRWINDSIFVVDPRGWNSDLYLKKEIKLVYPVDFSKLSLSDSILDENGMLDTTLFIADTVIVPVIDTTALTSLGISLHHCNGKQITPPLSDPAGSRTARLTDDMARVLYYLPGTSWLADAHSPFYVVHSAHHLDSLQQAVNTLLRFTENRDSTRLVINDIYGRKMPFWLTAGDDDAFRFWVKNYNNDSVTLWIGNPGTNEISLTLEDDVHFSRLMKEEISYLPSFIEPPERTLQPMTMLEPAPIYWDYDLSGNLALSQTYLANWTRGGESSFATMIDLMGRATYNNKEANTQWINMARYKFGTIMTAEKGFRKNHDEFEFDSKFNRNASGKIGMSASLYMKHQLARGYNYPNDSVAVSKFLNPGTMTVGLGVEYKPIKNTTVNVAPFSYKTTFVLDTAHIDQTIHGIDADKRAKRELGTQVVVSNKITPLKDLDVTNLLRLFSNYLNHPENIDVDWEMIVEKKINWFFTVRLNLHLIYDDDIRFAVYDDDEQPIILPGGIEKKVAKAQIREFVGLALQFNF
jgi:hypothetical protein